MGYKQEVSARLRLLEPLQQGIRSVYVHRLSRLDQNDAPPASMRAQAQEAIQFTDLVHLDLLARSCRLCRRGRRSLAFFLAHATDSAYPSLGLSLLTGLSETLDGAWGELTHDEELDVFITRQASPESIDRVRLLLARHFG